MKKLTVIIISFIILVSCQSTKGTTTTENQTDQNKVILVDAGDYHSALLTSDGQVYSWGANLLNELGNGLNEQLTSPDEITQNFNLTPDDKIIKLYANKNFNFAISSKGHIFSWGLNYEGTLGDGTNQNRSMPVEITQNFNLQDGETITDIVSGFHNIALTSNGRVFSWGYNRGGQLGDGTTTDSNIPLDITDNFQLNNDEHIKQVDVTLNYSVALTSEGRVFKWGYKYLKDNELIKQLLPEDITQILNTSSYCDFSADSCQGELDTLDLQPNETFIEIMAGNILVTSSGRIFSFDYMEKLGVDTSSEIKMIMVEYTNSFNLNTEDSIIDIKKGDDFTVALTSLGKVYAWGENEDGQIGDGTIFYQSKPKNITENFSLENNEQIIKIAPGKRHVIALTSTGRIFVWGSNGNGELGDGTKEDKRTPVEITINEDND